MKPKMIDVLIYITLIPAVVFGILSWCGREEWVLRRLPKSVIGAYLLYLSLVVWHFHGMSWVVVALAAAGIIVCAIAAYKGRRLKQASDWPVVEGAVLHVGEGRDADG